MSKELVIIIMSITYLAGSAMIGIWFTRRQKSLGTYFLAGKAVPPAVLGIATAAGMLSGGAFIGGAGLGYVGGIGCLTAAMITPFSAFLPWFFLARKFRTLADTHNCMTVPDVISARFNSNTLTLLCSLGALFGLIAYTATQYMALGFLLGVTLGFHFEVAILISVVIVAAYTVLGGQQGVLWTNVLQGILMIAAAVGGFFFAWIYIGGPGPAYSGMKSIDPKLVTFFGTFSIGFWVSRTLIFCLGCMGRLAFIPRFLMIKNLDGLKWAPVLTPLFSLGMGMLSWSIPFAYLALQAQGLAPALIAPDECMPNFLMLFTPNILAGMLVAGALAATMSTASLYMNLGAATLVNDLGMRHLKLKFKNPVAVARWATVLFTLVVTILALTAGELIEIMVLTSMGVWGSTIGVVLTLGLCWKGATKEGAIAGAVVGLFFSVVLAITGIYEIYELPFGIIPGAPGIVLAFVTMFIVSLYTKKTPMDEKMERVVGLPLIARGM